MESHAICSVLIFIFRSIYEGSTVYADINIALNKLTFASSSDPRWGGHTSVAVNGDLNTHLFAGTCCTHTAGWSPNPWWAVDLVKDVKLYKVTVLNRSDCCSERLHDFNAAVTRTIPTLVAPTPTNYELCATYTGTVSAGGRVQLYCAPGVHGRYLVIQIPGPSEVLTLCEVEAFLEEYEHNHIYSAVSNNVKYSTRVLGSYFVLSSIQCVQLCMANTSCRSVNVKQGPRICHYHGTNSCRLQCELLDLQPGTSTPSSVTGWKLIFVK